MLERHDIPQVLTGNLTNQPGHDLASEIEISVCTSAHRSTAHNDTPTKHRCTPMSLCRVLAMDSDIGVASTRAIAYWT